MKNSSNIEGFQFVLQAALVSFILAKNLNAKEQELLGNFLQSVGTNLTNIAAFEIVEELEEDNTNKD